MEARTAFSPAGVQLYALAAIVFGVTGLAWGDFATVWQPVQPTVPHRTLLAYLFALAMLGAGAATVFRRSARAGLPVLALLYAVAAALWLPRVIHFPQLFGTWGGFAEELALVMGAAVAYGTITLPTSSAAVAATELCRIVFGMCVVAFAVQHFTAIPQTAGMVPAWLPPGPRFWAIGTGVAHFVAGVAIVSGMQGALAARLLASMFGVFTALVWVPRLAAAPLDHTAWGGNAITVAMAAASWIVADWLAMRASEETRAHRTPAAKASARRVAVL